VRRNHTPSRSLRRACFVLAVLASLAFRCAGPSPVEISSDRAIDVARSHVSFVPDMIDVVRATSSSRAVWRVTFKGRLPGQPPGLFEIAIVEVDRVSGEVVSVGRD
jgi:hypothetical protein